MYNYNLKNEDTYYWIHQLCISDQPIPFYNININIPHMKDIMALRPSFFNSLCIPFSYSKDCFDVFRDIKIFNTLDCFYYSSEKDISLGKNNIFYTLLYAISFFTKIDIKNIKYYNNKENNGHVEIVIEDLEKVDEYNMPFRFCIDGNRFDELASIIRLICNLSLLTKEDMEKQFEDDIQKEEYQALVNAKTEKDREEIRKFYSCLRMNEKEKQKRGITPDKIKIKSTKIVNIYRVVCNYWKSYEKVNKLNLYQLYNSYNSIKYDIRQQYDIGIATSGWASKNFVPSDITVDGAI